MEIQSDPVKETDTMPLEKHDLAHELPESKEAIHILKTSNTHFAKLFDEYNDAEHAVHRIESGAEHASDDHLGNLKKQRLNLKDQLAAMIREYDASLAR